VKEDQRKIPCRSILVIHYPAYKLFDPKEMRGRKRTIVIFYVPRLPVSPSSLTVTVLNIVGLELKPGLPVGEDSSLSKGYPIAAALYDELP
jgi:hypothetical protein